MQIMKRPTRTPTASRTGAAAAPARGDYPGPRSPVRVMQIIELLAGANGGLSLAAMTDALQIPKTSLLNHLRVLVGSGYVSLRDARYTIGSAAMRLGAIIAADAGVLAAWRPVAADLVARSGETAMLATLDERNAEAVYMDVLNSPQDIRYSPRIGSRWALYCTGVGRVLLAFQDEAFIRSYLAEADIARRTAVTITDRARLRQMLDVVRSAGVCISQGEHTVGAGAVAAPIVERDGRVRHAISIGLPVARLEPRRELLAGLVLAAARQVSWTLGGQVSDATAELADVTARPPGAETGPRRRAPRVAKPRSADGTHP